MFLQAGDIIGQLIVAPDGTFGMAHPTALQWRIQCFVGFGRTPPSILQLLYKTGVKPPSIMLLKYCFKNRSLFGEVMGKSVAAHFFDSQCSIFRHWL